MNSENQEVTLQDDCVYPFGIDHAWYLGKNELAFANSLKMKLSVILGIAQMSLGIFLKASNAIYFKQKLELYFEFIPQIVLLWCIFGYMITLIIVKWLTLYPDTSTAPAIIAYMIEMFLNFGAISGDAIIHSNGINETLHVFLLLTALLCIPTMLLVKPYMIWKESKEHPQHHGGEIEMQEFSQNRGRNQYHRFEEDDDIDIGMPREEKKGDFGEQKAGAEVQNQESDALKERLYSSVSDIMDDDHHEISEVAIHQLIETIEFVLGTISNTASYLRLWALSLAHSQLAAVFFEKVLDEPLKESSGMGLFLLFPMFATATIGVLM